MSPEGKKQVLIHTISSFEALKGAFHQGSSPGVGSSFDPYQQASVPCSSTPLWPGPEHLTPEPLNRRK